MSGLTRNVSSYERRHPGFVAGVPPDYFSAEGQLWGNPVYNWDALRATGYRLVDRPSACASGACGCDSVGSLSGIRRRVACSPLALEPLSQVNGSTVHALIFSTRPKKNSAVFP